MITDVFCKIVKGELSSDGIIYQDDDFIVKKDINPQAPIHFIIFSKKHIFGIWKIRISNLFRISDFGFRIFQSGFGLLEMIIAVAVVITALVGFLETERVSLRLLRTEKDNLEATFLAQEGLEAARILRGER